ncbi:MAG: methylated-DNA--[protein]-cysteine S-methyltransferase [Candidatus Nitrotoga sp.]
MKINYQARFLAPFGLLGIRCDDVALSALEFLGAGAAAPAHTPLAREVCQQLAAYFSDAAFQFDLPLHLTGTAHQTKVWQAIRDIPAGRTRQYGELATLLHSSARAVGGACGTNPIPIVIPCHRVLSKSGLGGFMQQHNGSALDIKRWLLNHEQRLNSVP